MWKTIPALVDLRQEVAVYLDSILEKGGPDDFVTTDFLIKAFTKSHPEIAKHHPDQIRSAIRDNVPGVFVGSIVLGEGDPDSEYDICMNCSTPDKLGYIGAMQFVKLRDGTRCPYNYGCGCDF